MAATTILFVLLLVVCAFGMVLSVRYARALQRLEYSETKVRAFITANEKLLAERTGWGARAEAAEAKLAMLAATESPASTLDPPVIPSNFTSAQTLYDPEDDLSTTGAAAILGISVRSVQRLAVEGCLPHRRNYMTANFIFSRREIELLASERAETVAVIVSEATKEGVL